MAAGNKVEGTKEGAVTVQVDDDGIPWIPPVVNETTKEKFVRKVKENPLVPVGVFATVTALTLGLVNFKRGDSLKQQFYMRARVLAQGFTLVAVLGGLYVTTMKSANQDKSKNTHDKDTSK